MSPKKSYSQEILIISVLTLTISLLWIYLSVFKALTKTENPVLKPNETRLLVPKLESEVFSELKNKKN